MTEHDDGPERPPCTEHATPEPPSDHVDPADSPAAARPAPAGASGQPRAEEFDRLVQELLPKIRVLLPHLSELETLRAAALMAEYRLAEEKTLMWGSP